VIDSLRRARFDVDSMEVWPADSEEPKVFSQKRLKGCDLCVLLVAWRRGFVPEGERLSITQLEYEAAIREGIDVLVFLLADDAPWPPPYVDKDPEAARWREELQKSHGRETFGLEPNTIDMTGALSRWLTKKAQESEDRPPRQWIEKHLTDLIEELRGYPETLSLHCREIMQHPCGNETQGDCKERVDSA